MQRAFTSVADVTGKSLHRISNFANFDLSFSAVARIDPAKCIKCDLCYVACNDTAHQCIDLIGGNGEVIAPYAYSVRSNGKEEAITTRPQPRVREPDCVGCRLCYNVCPVEGCIEMVEVPSGREAVTWEQLCRSQPEVTEDWDAMQRYREQTGIRIH